MINKKYLYISIGEYSIYYTLREKRYEVVYTERSEYGYNNQYGWVDYYLFNLSTDKNEAIKKAKEYSEKNNISLYGTSDSLIVTGKIGDAKEDREKKYGLPLGGQWVEKKASNREWSIPKRTPEEIEADRVKREKEQAEYVLLNKKRLEFYKNPIWKKIKKHLYFMSLNKAYNDYGLSTKMFPRGNRYIMEMYCEGFVYEMYRNIKNKIIISGRALDIVFEIYAKQFGRKGSKAYKKVYNELYNISENGEQID
jgi:hypothetical protein